MAHSIYCPWSPTSQKQDSICSADKGNSEYAAAYAAALAVYLISIYRQEFWNQVTPHYSFPEIVKDSVLIRSWSRNGGPSAIANGLSGHKDQQSEISPWKWAVPRTQAKRDDQSDQSQLCLGNSTVQSSDTLSFTRSLPSLSARSSEGSEPSSTAVSISGTAVAVSPGARNPEQTTSNSTEESLHSSTAQDTAIPATTSTPIVGIPHFSPTTFDVPMASTITYPSSASATETPGVATAGLVSPPEVHIPVCNVKGWRPWQDSCIENCNGGVCTGYGTNQNEPPIWYCSHCPNE